MQLAPPDLWPNAMDKTGRFLARFILPNSLFWPTGVIDPNNGHVETIRVPGYDEVAGGGRAPDGKLILNAGTLRASVWRFRPEGSNR